MAKNYTFNEAVKIIAKGTDMEAITDIGRRYPVLATKVAVVAAKAGEDFINLMGYMPDYLTANKVNTAIKADIAETGSESESNEDKDKNEDATEATAEDIAEDATEITAQWNENMNAKQLWEILGKAGKRKLAKSTKKADLIEACKKAFGKNTEAEDAETEDKATEFENAYKGKSAMELFKECKARKIKVAPKKPAKYYADILAKDDTAEAEAAEDKSDDNWDDEEAETSKKEEKKTAKSTVKSGKAKAAKKVEVESDDDDDDWDI